MFKLTHIPYRFDFTRLKRLVRLWIHKQSLNNRLVTILIICALGFGALTYASLTNVPPFGNNSNALILFMNVTLVILLALFVLIARRIMALYISRKKGLAGSKLHIRLVFIFALLAAIPSAFMALFSVVFFYFGVHGWLDDRVRTAINESQAVAEAYLREHQQLIRADIMALASDLDRQAVILSTNEDAMMKMLKTQSFLRDFSAISLLDSNGKILLQTNPDIKVPSTLISNLSITKDTNGNDVTLIEKDNDGISAVLKLNNYIDSYVYTERQIDPKVLAHVERASQGVKQYKELQRYSTSLQILLTAIYVIISLLLTIAATWFGLSFAKRLMTPITDLIYAAESMSAGDLSVRVDPTYAIDEFKTLAQAYNNMTEQIEAQQKQLVSANAIMDFRRRFTETILGGVSTGVLSVDSERLVTLANNAAGELFQCDLDDLLGQKISYVMPEIIPVLDECFDSDAYGKVHTCEIQARRMDQSIRIFMVRIVIELLDNKEKGAIITFDDLTTVLSNQRKAAWADVARRIAHEIKNPLTPIQLSAERLNRKYNQGLSDKDSEIFTQSTDTIIKHVQSIKSMVNSFSEFAKMPDAILKNENILLIIKEVFTFYEESHPDIRFNFHKNFEERSVVIPHDVQQIKQFLTNLIKNSIEAIQAKDDTSPAICVFVMKDNQDDMWIGVADNGSGLPKNIAPDKLLEPYITQKEKGTGLGLAIVKKIAEDHQGVLLFNKQIPDIVNNDIYTTKIAMKIHHHSDL